MTKKVLRWPSGRQGMAVLESLKGVGRARTEPFKVTGERLSLLAGSTLGQAKVSILVNGNPVVSRSIPKRAGGRLGRLELNMSQYSGQKVVLEIGPTVDGERIAIDDLWIY